MQALMPMPIKEFANLFPTAINHQLMPLHNNFRFSQLIPSSTKEHLRVKHVTGMTFSHHQMPPFQYNIIGGCKLVNLHKISPFQVHAGNSFFFFFLGSFSPLSENVCQGTFEDKKILNKKERKQLYPQIIISGFILQRILKNINM